LSMIVGMAISLIVIARKGESNEQV
jgi:hypothetical protein